MKKLGIFLVLMLLLCSLMLSSCSAWEAVTDFFRRDVVDKVMRAMEKASSYETEGYFEMTVFYDKTSTTFWGESKQIAIQDDDGLYYYSREYIDGGIFPKITLVEMYQDGTYFYSYSPSEKTPSYRYYSPTEEKDFIRNMTERSGGINGFSGYSSLTHTEAEDGTQTIVLTGYSEDIVKAINESYGLPFSGNGGKVSDIVVTLTTDSEFRLLSAQTKYLFTDDKSTGGQLIQYKNYGGATPLGSVNTADYKRLDSTIALPRLTKLFSDLKNKEEGEFTYTLSGEMVYDGEAVAQVDATKEGSFGTDEYGFYFDISSTSDIKGAISSITYSNGEFLVDGKENDLTQGKPQNADLVARAMVVANMMPITISLEDIENASVEKKGGTTSYDITYKKDYTNTEINAVVEMIMAELKADEDFDGKYMINGRTLSLHIEVKGDEIVALQYSLEIEGVKRVSSYVYETKLHSVKATIRIEF